MSLCSRCFRAHVPHVSIIKIAVCPVAPVSRQSSSSLASCATGFFHRPRHPIRARSTLVSKPFSHINSPRLRSPSLEPPQRHIPHLAGPDPVQLMPLFVIGLPICLPTKHSQNQFGQSCHRSLGPVPYPVAYLPPYGAYHATHAYPPSSPPRPSTLSSLVLAPQYPATLSLVSYLDIFTRRELDAPLWRSAEASSRTRRNLHLPLTTPYSRPDHSQVHPTTSTEHLSKTCLVASACHSLVNGDRNGRISFQLSPHNAKPLASLRRQSCAASARTAQRPPSP